MIRPFFVVLLPAASLAGLAGCGEFYNREWNALGHIQVEAPPRSPRSREPEQPSDPGVRIVWLNGGVLAGGGGTLSTSSRGAYAVGGEASLHVGFDDRTSSPFFARRSVGLNLGMNVVDSSVHGAGPAYAEVQVGRNGLWLAAGWAYDLVGREQGPQATAGLGPVYVRWRQLFDRDGSIVFGLAIKGGLTWITSR